MHDGYFTSPTGSRVVQAMQFEEGDFLGLDLTCPPGLDPNVPPSVAAPAAARAPAATPPTDAELVAAYKLFQQGSLTTLKKRNPGKSVDAVKDLCKDKWALQPTARQMIFVGRVRARATAGPAPEVAERVTKAGQPVPHALWGRHKGLAQLLHERGLYPAAGLKGACTSSKLHAASNDCCCARMLAVQRDFAAECSALQHLVEERIPLLNVTFTTKRHHCLFLPKVRPPPPRARPRLPAPRPLTSLTTSSARRSSIAN